MNNDVCKIIAESVLGTSASDINDTLDGIESSILEDAVERVKEVGQGFSLRSIWEEAMWVALEKVFGEYYDRFSLGNKMSYYVSAYESDLDGVENLDEKIAEFEDLTDFEISLM